MGKKIRGVKLKAEDINKNSSIDISHSINKIVVNERKYTIILVFAFIIVFLCVGFYLFRADVKKIYEVHASVLEYDAPIVKLTDNDVFSDTDGLKRPYIKINVSNNTESVLNYRIILKEDIISKSECGCKSDDFDLKKIRYSFDGKNIKKINNDLGVITTGVLKEYEDQNIKVKLWLNNNDGSHFHGKIIVEKIEIED